MESFKRSSFRLIQEPRDSLSSVPLGRCPILLYYSYAIARIPHIFRSLFLSFSSANNATAKRPATYCIGFIMRHFRFAIVLRVTFYFVVKIAVECCSTGPAATTRPTDRPTVIVNNSDDCRCPSCLTGRRTNVIVSTLKCLF